MAVVAGGDSGSYRVAACWVIRATAANRELARRYPAILSTEFPGSSRRWVAALIHGHAPPIGSGFVWVDADATTLREARLGARSPIDAVNNVSVNHV
jgi:hypothetical protein